MLHQTKHIITWDATNNIRARAARKLPRISSRRVCQRQYNNTNHLIPLIRKAIALVERGNL